MEPQGRGSVSPLSTRRRNRALGPRKTTLGVGVHAQTVGLNAETRIGRYSAVGEIFLLTCLFIGLVRVGDYTAMWRFIPRCGKSVRVEEPRTGTSISSQRMLLRDNIQFLIRHRRLNRGLHMMCAQHSLQRRRKGPSLVSTLICVALLSCCAAWSQLATPDAPAPGTKAETPKDTLGRETPRGTVLGFLSAARKGNAQIAALYLNTPLRGADAEALARQLAVVLDRRLPARLNELSDKPEGRSL